MKIIFKRALKMIIILVAATLIFAIVTLLFFTDIKSIGRTPDRARLERIKLSKNFRDGEFRNLSPTELMTATDKNKRGIIGNLFKFIFRKDHTLSPDLGELEVIRSNVKDIDSSKNYVVWFGHSSYLLGIEGKRYLIDPVFYNGSPVSFINRPFKGTSIYTPEDIGFVDYIIITHDHYDHLDHKSIKELDAKVGKFIVPLGVGSHLEYWGINQDKIVELDWWDNFEEFTCTPARHFSGRSLKRNKTLWASFILKNNNSTIYIGGDSGYDSHFKEIGEKFNIDYAFIENGQYSPNWSQIHTLPSQLPDVMKDLNAENYITVHHSKFALSTHAWDEPLRNEKESAATSNSNLIILTIGEIRELK